MTGKQRWLLLALSNAPINNTTEARWKAEYMIEVVDELEAPPAEEETDEDG